MVTVNLALLWQRQVTFNLCILSSNKVDVAKAVLIFLPIVFLEARGSAAARDLLKTRYFSFDPQLRSLYPQENWDQLSSSSYKACKLALTAKGDNLTIPDPDVEIGTSSWGTKQQGFYVSSGEVTLLKDKYVQICLVYSRS